MARDDLHDKRGWVCGADAGRGSSYERGCIPLSLFLLQQLGREVTLNTAGQQDKKSPTPNDPGAATPALRHPPLDFLSVPREASHHGTCHHVINEGFGQRLLGPVLSNPGISPALRGRLAFHCVSDLPHTGSASSPGTSQQRRPLVNLQPWQETGATARSKPSSGSQAPHFSTQTSPEPGLPQSSSFSELCQILDSKHIFFF